MFRVSAWLDSIARALRVCAGLVSHVSKCLRIIARVQRMCWECGVSVG